MKKTSQLQASAFTSIKTNANELAPMYSSLGMRCLVNVDCNILKQQRTAQVKNFSILPSAITAHRRIRNEQLNFKTASLSQLSGLSRTFYFKCAKHY